MNRTPNASHPNRNIFACAARAVAWIGRILLSLTALLLITTPLTQRIWSWDHFLHGGRDYESSTLLLLALLCLVLVIAQHCKQSVSLLFVARRQSLFLPRDPLSAGRALMGAFSISHSECGASPGLGIGSFPLQI